MKEEKHLHKCREQKSQVGKFVQRGLEELTQAEEMVQREVYRELQLNLFYLILKFIVMFLYLLNFLKYFKIKKKPCRRRGSLG